MTGEWKQLILNAMEANNSLKHSSYFQLATIGTNGKPANRTVVFRGFQENCDKIQINTDTRTNKIDDLKHCPFAEICWYFTDSWEQFRINGMVDVIDGSCPDPLKLQQREKAWFSSSPRSKLQYLGPHPGLPQLDEHTPNDASLDPSAGPVDAFCLLVLDPDQVDYVNLKKNERLKFVSKQAISGQKSWSSELLKDEVTVGYDHALDQPLESGLTAIETEKYAPSIRTCFKLILTWMEDEIEFSEISSPACCKL